uniref:Uncharacterized protein n=1 Tax=Fagus sylvatica TaxID=28930 RepID=A0A2N9IKX6_FAGSY
MDILPQIVEASRESQSKPKTPTVLTPPLSPRIKAARPPLTSGPDGAKPPPSLPFTTFFSTSQSPDLVLHEGDLMESLGGLSLQQISSLLSASSDHSGGRRDPLRRWMLDGHRVWRFISACVYINYPTLRVDYSKLFLKSPYHTRIEWQIRFDLYVVFLAEIKDLNFLLVWTLTCCGCSCNLLEFGQALCCVLLFLLLLL